MPGGFGWDTGSLGGNGGEVCEELREVLECW